MAHHACALGALGPLFAETPVRGDDWSIPSSALCFMMKDDMRTLKNNGRWVDESASGGNEDVLDMQKRSQPFREGVLILFTSCNVASSRKKKETLAGCWPDSRSERNEMLQKVILPSLPRDLRVEHGNMCVVHAQGQSVSLEATRSHARACFPLPIGQRWSGRDPR